MESIPEGETLYLGRKGIRYAKVESDTVVHNHAEHDAEREALATAKTEIDAALAYEPNAAIFGSSRWSKPWKFGLWVHTRYANSTKPFGRWMFKQFAEPPVLISHLAPQTRSKIASNILHDYGYFRGDVDYTILPGKKANTARILYDVTTGPVFHLDSIEYRSFGPEADSLLATSLDRPLLKSGDAFSVINLSAEQTRINDIMRNNGYYYWAPQYTSFQADTLSREGYVQLRVLPQSNIPSEALRPWFIGRTTVNINDPNGLPLDNERTMRRSGFTFRWAGATMPVKGRLWRTAISHRKGQPYSLENHKSTLAKLSALGFLSSIDVVYSPRENSDSLAAPSDTLDVTVNATVGKLYDSSFEVNTTLKSTMQLGPGVRYELAKRNALGGGEKVSWDIYGSYEWQLGGSKKAADGGLINSFALGTKMKFELPRFAFPGISRRRLRFASTTEFAIGSEWANRSGFYQMLNFNGNISYRWSKRRLRHQWDLVDINYYHLNHTTEAFREILTDNPAIAAAMANVFIPAMAYSLTYNSPAGTRCPVWMQWAFKESGNVTDGLHRLCYPHHEGNAPRRLFDTNYAQFLKTTAEAHYTVPLNEHFTLASRLFGGVIFSYGNNTTAPYTEQFYCGGANSIRAFTVRTIGPGGYRVAGSKYAYVDQTGDVKVEGNVELRARLVGDLHSAVFLDAGNVWLLRPDAARPDAHLCARNLRNIALGTGVGLRYDMDILVLRVDLGIGLHAPYPSESGRTNFYNFDSFGRSLALHIAIGYPF